MPERQVSPWDLRPKTCASHMRLAMFNISLKNIINYWASAGFYYHKLTKVTDSKEKFLVPSSPTFPIRRFSIGGLITVCGGL